MAEIKDAGTVLKIVLAVASLFSLNNIQMTRLKQYAENNMYTWIAQQRREDEIEHMLKSEARTYN